MNNKKLGFFAIMGFIIGMSHGCKQKLSDEFVGMKSSEPATQWQDALVGGNGKMGIMVFGDPENEKVIFNHEFCYEPIGNEDVEPPDIARYLPETRQLFLQGKYQEAYDYSYAMAQKEGHPDLLWTDPYHPALQMKIYQQRIGETYNYSRSVNFETGEVHVTWSDDSGVFKRNTFVSRPDNMVVQQIIGDTPITCVIEIADTIEKERIWSSRMEKVLNIKTPELTVSPDWITFRQAYSLNERGYEAGNKIILKGGSSQVTGNQLRIADADEILILTRIHYLEDYSQSELDNIRRDLDALRPDYAELLKKHAAIHGEMFNRVKLDLFTGDGKNKTSEQFIAQQNNHPDSLDPAFLEAMFNMGRYALISSSGNNPPNLVALWTGDWRPAWSGDFTLDANINLQIAAANTGNLKEGIESYMNMLERIAPDWEINAKLLYGCRGYLSGIRTSGRRNLQTHFNHHFPGHLWLAGAQWLLLPAYEYYQVSGDVEFLKSRLLPMMKKVVLFFEDFLTEYDDNGNYIFVPSYSPENTPANITTSASINATMDIAAAKEAIVNLIAVCKELNVETRDIPRWEAMLEKIPPYLVNADGALQEWAREDLEDNYNHRHRSHLYPLWPGHEINPEETPELFEAARIAAKLRGRGNESAFGLTHMALIGSRLKQDELVYENLMFLLTRNFIYRSLFTAHNPNLHNFNADMLISLPAVVMEMLVYSRPGVVELLPACSEKLDRGKITGVKCRTQATIETLEWDFDEKKIQATILSDKDQTVEIIYRKGFNSIRCSVPFDHITENSISVDLYKDKKIDIEIQLL